MIYYFNTLTETYKKKRENREKKKTQSDNYLSLTDQKNHIKSFSYSLRIDL